MHFSWMWRKKIIKHFAKKKFGCSKMPKIGPLNTIKLFFGKMFYFFFFFIFMKIAIATISWFFIKQNAHGVTTVFINSKILDWKKTFFSMLFQKTVFWSWIWSKNLQKKEKFHSKKFCWVIFSYKNWTYWFLRA